MRERTAEGRRSPARRSLSLIPTAMAGGSSGLGTVDAGQLRDELEEEDDGEMNEVKMEKSPYLTIYRSAAGDSCGGSDGRSCIDAPLDA